MPIVSKLCSSKKVINIKSNLSFHKPIKSSAILPNSKEIYQTLRKFAKNGTCIEYESLICLMRDLQLTNENIECLLKTSLECVPLLHLNAKAFVEIILSIKWFNYSSVVVCDYEKFVINLLSAHNYHSKFVIDCLVTNFSLDGSEWDNGIPDNEECKIYNSVHSVISKLLKTIPMCRSLLLQSLNSHYPYFKKSTRNQEIYVHNLLLMLMYEPELRLDILHLIFSRLIILDANAPIEDIQKAENEVLECSLANTNEMNHHIAHSLDVCLDKVFNYFIVASHDTETGHLNGDKTESLYNDMIIIFNQVLLPTYNINHTQFVMFLLCSFSATITESFLKSLWERVCSPNVPQIHRHSAVVYIASLIARGSFVKMDTIKAILQQLANWIHSYIGTQDGLECINSDVRVHFVFYSVCQALFYVIAFRHKDFVNNKKDVVFLESLNLVKIVTCRLNPLRVCHSAVVRNFASVTRTYQLVYCYAVIEHNSRNIIPTLYQDETGSTEMSCNKLESFFPFDPYLLKRSGQKIRPIYVKYQAKLDCGLSKSENNLMETDDYIYYGSSPGFNDR